ncbi:MULTISPECIES: hypothetical protein [Halomonadaceae]|nr:MULTISPECIES: hypothetical protein [Halomonas]
MSHEDFQPLGADYSTIDHDQVSANSDADRYGAHLRPKYQF